MWWFDDELLGGSMTNYWVVDDELCWVFFCCHDELTDQVPRRIAMTNCRGHEKCVFCVFLLISYVYVDFHVCPAILSLVYLFYGFRCCLPFEFCVFCDALLFVAFCFRNYQKVYWCSWFSLTL